LNSITKSWIPVQPDSDFPIQNIPFGIYQKGNTSPAVCSVIGDQVIDLSILHVNDLLTVPGVSQKALINRYLNDFIALGKQATSQVRARLIEIFSEDADMKEREIAAMSLMPLHEVEMLLPLRIGNYTDFYSSKEHATNVGTMFRDPANALLPNWLHLPVGYHGRASSIVVSGTSIKRPSGQTAPGENGVPGFGPTKLLDFELEMGFVIGSETQLGQQVSTTDAEDYIFGLVLFNDWSARDIQQWEYVPLGPFLAKNFGSTISPWIVTLDALEPFRVDGPDQSPPVLPYLQYTGKKNYDILLHVDITTPGGQRKTVSSSNFKYMYWNMCQQLAHHTVNGCNIQVGDLYASGTISGPDPSSYGSMLELTWRGTKPIDMPDGTQRKFIDDGDTVTLRGYAEKDGVRIGFGEASGKIV
jgi:fumarylacetoacetase